MTTNIEQVAAPVVTAQETGGAVWNLFSRATRSIHSAVCGLQGHDPLLQVEAGAHVPAMHDMRLRDARMDHRGPRTAPAVRGRPRTPSTELSSLRAAAVTGRRSRDEAGPGAVYAPYARPLYVRGHRQPRREHVATADHVVELDVLLDAVEPCAARAEDDRRRSRLAEDRGVGPVAQSRHGSTAKALSDCRAKAVEHVRVRRDEIRRPRQQQSNLALEFGILGAERRGHLLELFHADAGTLAGDGPPLDLEHALGGIRAERAAARESCRCASTARRAARARASSADSGPSPRFDSAAAPCAGSRRGRRRDGCRARRVRARRPPRTRSPCGRCRARDPSARG